METLPLELIELILCNKNLSIRDVMNFSFTSRHNNLFVTHISGSIWKKKCSKICPELAELFKNNMTDINWYAELQYICDLQQRTCEMVSSMSPRFFKSYVLSNSDFTEWFELYQEKPQTYYYLVEYLTSIVNTQDTIETLEAVPITTPGNKTLQHYAMKVLRYLCHLHLAKEWKTFMALPPKLQTLEKGIAFIGQWFQPNCVSWNNIATELDKLADQVKKSLKMVQPNHPLFVAPREQLEMWRNENIECDQYDFLHCIQIKCVMGDVMKYQFEEFYTCNNIFVAVNLLENTVGCASQAISMVIFESVGRRLGVKYDPFFRPNKGVNLRSCSGCIDFNYCYYGHEKPELAQVNLRVATTQQVVEYIAKKIRLPSTRFLPNMVIAEELRTGLQFRELVNPSDVTIKYCLTQFYMDYNMDSGSYIEALIEQQRGPQRQLIQSFIRMLQKYETRIRKPAIPFRRVETPMVHRPPNLKYAVGMVMQCSLLDKTQLCVICDWAPDHFYSLEKPYYNVLLKNGLYADIRQEELTLPRFCSTSDFLALDFRDIGWSFSHRFEAVFVPNAQKQREYPADTAVRNKYNEQIKLGIE